MCKYFILLFKKLEKEITKNNSQNAAIKHKQMHIIKTVIDKVNGENHFWKINMSRNNIYFLKRTFFINLS